MPYSDPKEARACTKRWYQRNATSEKKRIYKRRADIRLWYKQYKRTLSCSTCTESHPACLEFHHKQSNKEKSVSTAVKYGWSKEHILKEIAKCKVVCANCHKKIHFKKYW